MNRQQATELLQKYRDLPATGVFNARPMNYPLFHLFECHTKENWDINLLGSQILHDVFDFDVEQLAREMRQGKHYIWTYVAKNRNVKNTMIAFVQEDLYCRYVARLNPLRTKETTATFIPWDEVKGKEDFKGKIGKHTKLYALEIDTDIVTIKGKWDKNVPWHYLQQTIEWVPFTDRIPWQEGEDQEPPPENGPVIAHAGPRVRFQHNPEPYPGRVAVHRNVYADIQPQDHPAVNYPPADNIGAEAIQGMEDVRYQAYQNAREALGAAFDAEGDRANRIRIHEEAQQAVDEAQRVMGGPRIILPDDE